VPNDPITNIMEEMRAITPPLSVESQQSERSAARRAEERAAEQERRRREAVIIIIRVHSPLASQDNFIGRHL